MKKLVENVDYTIKNGVLKINEGVEHIPNYAFDEKIDITEVILPSSLISIGRGAFKFTLLTKVVIPDSVRYIKYDAFYNCRIQELTLGKNVMYIGTDAFRSNKIAKVINNSTELRFISSGAFLNNEIKEFVVNSVPLYISYGVFSLDDNKGVIKSNFGMDQILRTDSEDVCSFSTKDKYTYENGVLKIKDGVKYIGSFKELHEDCTRVEMPDSVLIILDGAFYNFGKLEHIKFSNSLICILDLAFSRCSLRKYPVVLPDSTVIIIGDPFTYNMGDNKISVPSNIYFDVIDIEKEKYEIRTDNKINYILDINALLEEERTKLTTLGLLPETINENKKLDRNIKKSVGDILKTALITLIMDPNYNENNNLPIVLKILEMKAFDVNDLEEQINQLFLKKQIQTIYLLMSYGYDFMNNCMISKAIIYNIPEMIEVLLILGVDINEVGIFDMPPLSIATQKGDYKLVQYLIEHGAAISKEDSKNKKAIDYAEENGYSDIVDLINSYNETSEMSTKQEIEALQRLLTQRGKV